MDVLLGLAGLLLNILVVLVIIRVIFSWFPHLAWSTNPLVVIVKKIVDPLLNPIRRAMPLFGGIDFSPFVLIIVIEVISQVILSLPGGGTSPFQIVLTILGTFFVGVCAMIFLILLIRLLFDLLHVDRTHPVVVIMESMTDPFIQPFRRLRPARPGHFDAAPAFACGFYLVLTLAVQFIFFHL